jgi:hypothetical protein
MTRVRAMLSLLLVVGAVAGCGGGGSGAAPDLAIERRIGYAVVVDDSAGSIRIGFNTDRNAAGGDAYDISQSVWRVENGPWNQPPVTCIGKGQRIELGVSQVQNEIQPGLLMPRVIWVGCLAPPKE